MTSGRGSSEPPPNREPAARCVP